ncbi:MAG: ADP-ribosylglycohydrolase family protein [Lentisphaerae bacterium]|nr:ADP-ribosylglycohydrolase family protein [Lentisphaerota bacterium]
MKKRNIDARVKGNLTLRDRIEGCLVGAAIGAELGWTCHVHAERYRQVSGAKDLLNLNLAPVSPAADKAYRQQHRYAQHWLNPRLTPLIAIGMRAYVDKRGRATPEDFARALQNNRAIAGANRTLWMLFNTTQELLNEGCNPRISGMGTVPSGLVADAMAAVGIFHYGDPEYAYLDGVELASVCQPRLGADWAGLAAAAIASAFDPNPDPEAIVRAVLDIARENNREVFDELDYCVRSTKEWFADNGKKNEHINRWLKGFPGAQRESSPLAPNPIRFVLPLLKEPLDRDPRLLLSLLLCPLPGREPLGAPILGGAILGARHGRRIFPEEWRRWAEPIARAWHPIIPVVEKRRQREKAIITVHETLLRKKQNGMSLLEDKISGCLLASSIGNAMGSPVEGRSYAEIDAQYPGGIKTILKPERLESEDDNQQMMLLLETYLARQGRPVMARHLARTWCAQRSRANLWPFNDRHSYNLIRAGWDPRITGHWNPMGTSVMCIEPVGLYHLADPDYVVVDAPAIAYMHVRGIEIAATSILAAAVAEAMRPDATVDRVWDAALKVASHDWPLSYADQLRTLDGRRFKNCHDYLAACLAVAKKYDDVFAARKELYAKCLMFNWWQSAHLEIVGSPLAILKVANGDVRQAAIGGTNIGRDADTNAGRSAMLAGALRGAGAVPQEWIRMFKPAVLRRIKDHARTLARLISHQKLDRFRKRQIIDKSGG